MRVVRAHTLEKEVMIVVHVPTILYTYHIHNIHIPHSARYTCTGVHVRVATKVRGNCSDVQLMSTSHDAFPLFIMY